IAQRQNSYFNRDILHFCSHQHTPNNPAESFDGAVLTDNTAYIGWDIFSDYGIMGAVHNKELITYVIDQLLGDDKSVVAKLPDRGVTTLAKQEKENRYINHLLYAHTTNRGEFYWEKNKYNIEVIEDIIPLYDVEAKVKVAETVKKVSLVPENVEIPFTMEDGYVSYTVPKLWCHQMVVLDVE
ncbi:MAG: hypothetical protein R3Y24_15555, partial [Eubacteriales bacterium]